MVGRLTQKLIPIAMRARRSSTAASSKATASLQLQSADRLRSKASAVSKGPAHGQQSSKQHKQQQQKKRTGVNIPRRRGFWQPAGWNKNCLKKRAGTTFIGGLEFYEHHIPASVCTAECPTSAPQLEEKSPCRWLRWDCNPLWSGANAATTSKSEQPLETSTDAEAGLQLPLATTTIDAGLMKDGTVAKSEPREMTTLGCDSERLWDLCASS